MSAYNTILAILTMAILVYDEIRLRRMRNLVHQERVTIAIACSALKNMPDRYDDRHAFVASRLADIDKRVARRPK